MRSPAREMLKFMLPMFRLHISGFATSGAASRSSSVMVRPPPVVMLITASVLCLIDRQELHEHRRIGRRRAVDRIARMQVNDRRAGLGRLDGGPRDLLRGDRQIVRHAGRVDGTGDGAADDDLGH